MAIDETIPTITQYTGTIPNKATQTPTQFADNVYPFHVYYNDDFIPETTSFSESLNIFSGEANDLRDEVNVLADEASDSADTATEQAAIAVEAVATIPEGTLNDSITTTTNAWSATKINNEISAVGKVTFTSTSIYISSDDSAGEVDDGSSNNNIGMGVLALTDVTSGEKCVSFGYFSTIQNETGNNLTSLGFSANRNALGDYCTALGSDALQGDIALFTGSYDIGIGFDTGASLTTGQYNFLASYRSGYNLTTASNCVFIGKDSGWDLTTEDNQLRIGNYALYSNDLIEGDFDKQELKINGKMMYPDTVFTTNIDCSTGNSFNKTVTGNFTQTFSNEPTSGDACVIVLRLTNAGAHTITWDTNIKWSGGAAPTFTASGTDTVTMMTIDGGTTWNANALLGYA